MTKQRRNRAKVLTDEALKRLNAQIRQHECDANGAVKYSLEKLGELTGLDPETVGKVLSRQGNDKRVLDRCCNAFGIILTKEDYIPVSQATHPEIDPSFVGREEAIADLQELVNRNAKIIVIQARGGVGKTTLARRFLSQEFDAVLEFPIAKETKDIASIESLLEEKLRQLGEEPGREFIVSCDRLRRKLQNERIGILIDNLEPALDAAGKFIEPHRRYVEVLRILSDPLVQSTTLITSRERLRESSVTVQTYLLRSLDFDAWKEFFKNRGLVADTPALESLHNAYGGNAKAMEIICSAIVEDFDGDIDAYWEANQDDLFIERDLEDLVKQQFDRLQELDPDAYKLLCRMGCYRFQDVPTVPIEGFVCLLWDVQEKYAKRVIRALQDRSLLNLEGNRYNLHPIIREEALARLRSSQDLEISNQKAATFWSELVKRVNTIEDAMRALESHYHYSVIGDFIGMYKTLKKRRSSENFSREETLHLACYRLGIFQQVTNIVFELVGLSTSDYYSASLYNILGNLFWIKGLPNKAIEFHKKSKSFAEENAEKDLNKLDNESQRHLAFLPVYSLSNTGFCCISLWELSKAINYFKESIRIYKKLGNYKNKAHFSRAKLGLLFSQFYLGDEQPESSELDEICLLIERKDAVPWDSCICLMFLSLIYKKMGNFEKALDTCQRVIQFSQETNYVQLEAVGLRLLGSLLREEGRYNESLENHLEALRMLDAIGSKCDLAEAHLQIGLTYKKMGNVAKSRESFQSAIQIFTKIGAPKQVKRIKESIYSI